MCDVTVVLDMNGVVADVLRVEPQPLDGWLHGLGPAALALWLDGVGNPHNFGAILRTAAHFGASVLLPAGSPLALSGAAARVAEGGAEAVTLVRLPPPVEAIDALRRAGFQLAATVVRGGEDLFAHFSEIQASGFKTLQEGQRVEFTVAQGAKGPQATQIRPL